VCNGNGVQWNQLIIFNETTMVRHNSIILSTCCMLRVFLPLCNSSIFHTPSTNNVQLMKLSWAQPPPERGRVRPVPSDFSDPGTWHRSAHSRRSPVVRTNSSVFVKMHRFQHKFPLSSGCHMPSVLYVFEMTYFVSIGTLNLVPYVHPPSCFYTVGWTSGTASCL